MPQINIGEILSSTMPEYGKSVHDNVTGSNALLVKLKQKGRILPYNGGVEIREILEYAFNNTFMFYTGYEFLNTTPNEVLQSAVYPVKQASISVSISGREERQNRGAAEIVDLLAARMGNARRSAAHWFNQALYSDGTPYNGKSLQGLAAFVSKTPDVGSVGGIDASENPWWRNVAIDAATYERPDGTALGPITPANVNQYFNDMTLYTTRNNDGPDLIITDGEIYTIYKESLQEIQRVTPNGDRAAGWGFTSLKYYGTNRDTDVVLDGGRGGASIPRKTAYFINTDAMALREDPGRKWTVDGGPRRTTNQDAEISLLLWMGALTMSNRSAHGVLWDSTAV